MARILLIFLVLLFTFQSIQCQVTDSLTEQSKQEMYDFYSSKHKKLKRTGWILLGTGLGALTVGSIIAVNSDNTLDDLGRDITGGLLMAVGSFSMLASIPVFIVSGSHKRKANAILGSGEVGIGALPFNDARYASVGIKINF